MKQRSMQGSSEQQPPIDPPYEGDEQQPPIEPPQQPPINPPAGDDAHQSLH